MWGLVGIVFGASLMGAVFTPNIHLRILCAVIAWGWWAFTLYHATVPNVQP